MGAGVERARPGGLHDGALAHLDGQRRDEAVYRAPGIGLAQRGERRDGEDRRDGRFAGPARPDFGGNGGELRGLVAEHEQVRAGGNLGIVRERFAAHLLDDAARALIDRVRAQHRPPPPTGQRARHVPATDETYFHEGSRLVTIGARD